MLNTEDNAFTDHIFLGDFLVLTLLKFHDFLQRFLDQGTKPDNDVETDNVHHSEPVHQLVAMDVQPGIHEDDVGLKEGEEQRQAAVQSDDGIKTGTLIPQQLGEAEQLEQVVDKGAHSKDQDSQPDCGAPVALEVLQDSGPVALRPLDDVDDVDVVQVADDVEVGEEPVDFQVVLDLRELRQLRVGEGDEEADHDGGVEAGRSGPHDTLGLFAPFSGFAAEVLLDVVDHVFPLLLALAIASLHLLEVNGFLPGLLTIVHDDTKSPRSETMSEHLCLQTILANGEIRLHAEHLDYGVHSKRKWQLINV